MAGKEVAVVSKEIGTSVMNRITELVNGKQLTLPQGYDAGTAINSAMLILQDAKDRNNRPVLESCTKASIAKCVLDMVIQGLQPGKKQCYFIPYADQLTLFRSYFGTVAALKRAVPEVSDVVAEVWHEGDKPVPGRTKRLERYVQGIENNPFDNIDKPIAGGYCNIFDKDGEVIAFTYMTWDQIQTSWKQSRNFRDANGVHQKFPEEMCKRTLISKACKMILNTSSDAYASAVVTKSFNDTTDNEFMETQNEARKEQPKMSFKERYQIGDSSKPSEDGKVEEPKKEEEKPMEEVKDDPTEGADETSEDADEYIEDLFGADEPSDGYLSDEEIMF